MTLTASEGFKLLPGFYAGLHLQELRNPFGRKSIARDPDSLKPYQSVYMGDRWLLILGLDPFRWQYQGDHGDVVYPQTVCYGDRSFDRQILPDVRERVGHHKRLADLIAELEGEAA